MNYSSEQKRFLDTIPSHELTETDVEMLYEQWEVEQDRRFYEALEQQHKAEQIQDELKREGGR